MKGKELTSEQRERIIGAYLGGVKQIVISAQLNIAPSTVNDTITRYKKTHSATPKKRPGRPKVLTERDRRVLKRIVHEDRFGSLPVLTGLVLKRRYILILLENTYTMMVFDVMLQRRSRI
jgi:transposase